MDKPDKSPRDQAAPLSAKEEIGDFVKTALIAVILALLIRGLLYEPFNIPSGSMKPTLEIGDYLFANKRSYGYGQYSFSLFYNLFLPVPYQGRVWDEAPQRGDIAVFWLPQFGQNYIKRVIGLPGDTLQVRRGRLYINGEMAPRRFTRLVQDQETRQTVVMKEYVETLPGGIEHLIYEESDNGPLDNTPLYTVPDNYYFMMGDNRDNSQDSRVTGKVGPIPYENIIGRAEMLFFSTNGSAQLWEIWKWPWSIRTDRLLKSLAPAHEPASSEGP